MIAKTVCWRVSRDTELITWDSPQAAAEALRVLFDIPCGHGCLGSHGLAYMDAERMRIRGYPQPPPSLATSCAS